jgi:hypothetical protein
MNMSPDNISPWQEKGVSYKARYFSKIGFIFVAILLTFSIASVILGLIILRDNPGNFWKDGFPLLLISTIVTFLGIIAVIILIRTMRSPISFTPSYSQISPTQFGQTFEVWYEKPESHQSFDGKGSLRFDAAYLILTGTLSRRNSGGMISALLSLLEGREEISFQLPYENISMLTIKGRRMRFNIGGSSIFQRSWVIFYVSDVDGERMYRELKQRFPTALQEVMLI